MYGYTRAKPQMQMSPLPNVIQNLRLNLSALPLLNNELLFCPYKYMLQSRLFRFVQQEAIVYLHKQQVTHIQLYVF